jgi:hypothetical protein
MILLYRAAMYYKVIPVQKAEERKLEEQQEGS